MLLILLHCGMAQPEGDPALEGLRPGFGVKTRGDFWMPLELRLKNPGPATPLRLVFKPSGTMPGVDLRQHTEMYLPAGVEMEANLPTYLAPRGSFSGTPIDLGLMRVQDAEGRTLSQLNAFGFSAPSRHSGLLICDQRMTSYPMLDTLVWNQWMQTLTRMPILPNALPERPEMLDAVDLLILGRFDAGALSGAALASLDLFVRAGGTLVFIPSGEMPLNPPPQLAALLPATYLQRDTVSRYETGLPDLGGYTSTKGLERFALVGTDGAIELGDEDTPRAVYRRHGHGVVVALDHDLGNPGFQSWDRASDYLARILPSVSPLPRHAGRLLSDPRVDAVETAMSSLAGRTILSRQAVGLLMLGLVVMLGLLTGWAGLRTNRPLWGWGLSGGAALGAGLALALISLHSRSESNAMRSRISLKMPTEDRLGVVHHDVVGFYSPSGESFEMVPEGWAASVRPWSSSVRPPESLVLGWKGLPWLASLPVRADGQRTVSMQGLAEADHAAPSFTVHPGPEGLTVEATNPLPWGLESGVLRFRRLHVPLPDLDAESSASVEAVRPAPGPWHPLKQGVIGPEARRRAGIYDSLFAAETTPLNPWNRSQGLHTEWERPRALIWAADVPASGDAASEQHMTLYRLPVDWAWTPGPVRIPSGVLERRMPEKPPGLLEDPDGSVWGQQSRELRFDFTPPGDMPSLRPDRLRVRWDFMGSEHTCRVRIDSHPDPVQADAWLPADALGPAPWTVRVSIQPVGRGAMLAAWNLHYLELEIEGDLYD